MTDFFTEVEKDHNIKCVMLDLDGTIYLGNSVFDFTVDFLKRLDRIGIRRLFLTNNSSITVDDYLKKFARLGIPAGRDNILTSAQSAAYYINHGEFADKRVFALATDKIKAEMKDNGVNICEDAPEVLLATFDTSLTFDSLTKFTNYVADGFPYIVTHPDVICPKEEGFFPDLGSFIELIHSCTGRYPDKICGKPSEQMLAFAEYSTGIDRKNLLMVGDRLSTDIAIGKYGIRTALVLSGVSTVSDIDNAEVKPTYVFDSIKELGESIEQALCK